MYLFKSFKTTKERTVLVFSVHFLKYTLLVQVITQMRSTLRYQLYLSHILFERHSFFKILMFWLKLTHNRGILILCWTKWSAPALAQTLDIDSLLWVWALFHSVPIIIEPISNMGYLSRYRKYFCSLEKGVFLNFVYFVNFYHQLWLCSIRF